MKGAAITSRRVTFVQAMSSLQDICNGKSFTASLITMTTLFDLAYGLALRNVRHLSKLISWNVRPDGFASVNERTKMSDPGGKLGQLGLFPPAC